jgi:hypothetical protein
MLSETLRQIDTVLKLTATLREQTKVKFEQEETPLRSAPESSPPVSLPRVEDFPSLTPNAAALPPLSLITDGVEHTDPLAMIRSAFGISASRGD